MFHAETDTQLRPVIGALSGEIDMNTAPGVEVDLLAAVLAAAGSTAVIECRELSFFDSSGIHMLERVVEQSRTLVRLVNVIGSPRQVFEILGLCETYGLGESALA